jgi:hypothetical protein
MTCVFPGLRVKNKRKMVCFPFFGSTEVAPLRLLEKRKKKPLRNSLLRKGFGCRGNKTPVELIAAGCSEIDSIIWVKPDNYLLIVQPPQIEGDGRGSSP